MVCSTLNLNLDLSLLQMPLSRSPVSVEQMLFLVGWLWKLVVSGG